jgi:hypothetical protein
MTKKPLYLKRTPKEHIVHAVRKMWLRSRERYAALKKADNKCFNCGEIPVEVHHCRPIDWERIDTVIREEILNTQLLVVCRECHKILTETETNFRDKVIDLNNRENIIIGLKVKP